MMSKTFVVDTSVCLKLLFNDEIYFQEATNLFNSYADKKIDLILPNITIYELANAIRSKALSQKIVHSEADMYFKRLTAVFSNIVHMEDVMDICLKNAFKYNLSVYDATYITLAASHNTQLITADDKLVKNINDSTLAISLKDFII